MTPRKLLFAILLLLTLVLVRSIHANRSEDAADWRRKLLAVSQQIELGQTEEEVERLLAQRWPENLHNAGRVWTPHRWTSHNLNLLIDYKDRKVAALAIRTDDSYQRLPEGAPKDRVLEGFQPFWSMDY